MDQQPPGPNNYPTFYQARPNGTLIFFFINLNKSSQFFISFRRPDGDNSGWVSATLLSGTTKYVQYYECKNIN